MCSVLTHVAWICANTEQSLGGHSHVAGSYNIQLTVHSNVLANLINLIVI